MSKSARIGVWVAGGLVALLTAGAQAETVGWRSDWTGRYPDAKPPVNWSKEQGVLWTCKMPNKSNASPVIVGEKIFVCGEPDILICVNKADGKILWQQANPVWKTEPEAEQAGIQEKIKAAQGTVDEVKKLEGEAGRLRRKAREDAAAKAQVEALQKQIDEKKATLKPVEKYLPPATHGDNGYASPVPVSDGKLVATVFGVGTVAVYDLDGKLQWVKALGAPKQGWGHSASPVLHGGKLLIQYNGTLLAFDPATGAEAWKTPARQTWGTPTPLTIGGVDLVVTPVGDFIRISDGKALAQNLATNEYNGAVIQDGVAYFVDEKGAKALKLPASADEPFKPEELWKAAPKKERYYASPLIHDGLIYAVTRYGFMTVLDAKTGAEVATKDFKPEGGGGNQPFYPSIALAGPYVVVASEMGKTLVLEPGKELKMLANNTLEPTKATPVFEGSRVYIRGAEHLYCLGQ
ncbi:MAG: hypothetical protein AMXMBFR7_40590 [Planctomycetota bacterium]